jgi:hypothetical protein
MNSPHRNLSAWLLPGVTLQFTSCRRHAMDELTFGAANWSHRSTRQKFQSLVPQYANSLIGAVELALVQSGQPDELPTPTDVPVPTPRDVPVPEPMDIPPPTPRDVPPPNPDKPEVDPKPRPIP